MPSGSQAEEVRGRCGLPIANPPACTFNATPTALHCTRTIARRLLIYHHPLLNSAKLPHTTYSIAMPSKRGRPSDSHSSPSKRQKSNEPKVYDSFNTRIVPSSYKEKKDETEPEGLVAGLDEALDRAYYTVTPAAWSQLRRYKRFSSKTWPAPIVLKQW